MLILGCWAANLPAGDLNVVLESAGFSAVHDAFVLGHGDGIPPTQFAE
jgi:hypothetical protein